MHKFGYVAVSNTDNLLISSFVGVITAGIYSNYYLVIGSVKQILEQVVQGVAASVGNLGATENTKKVETVFIRCFLIGYWMAGIAGICLWGIVESICRTRIWENNIYSQKILY